MSYPPSSPSRKMTPRERVRAVLAHQEPDRVPFSWGFGPTPEMTAVLKEYLAQRAVDWPTLRELTEDVLIINPAYIGPELPPHVDIWGIRRKPQLYGAGSYDEFAFYPLAEATSPAEVEAYPWPDPESYDYASLRDKTLAPGPRLLKARKLSHGVCGNVFEIYCWMTGLEKALANLLLNPQVVHAALERITRFFEHKLRRSLAEVADLVDILYFADDLGTQRGLLMSRKAYREVVGPYHQRLFRLGKALASRAAVMLHSDGSVFDILPELMDVGLEVLEAVQVDAEGMAPERLKAAYGQRLCFYGGISVQSLLPHGSAETVMRECRRLVEVLGRDGGYIAAPTHAIQVGTPPENVLAMLRAVLGEEDYQAALEGARW